MILANCTIVDDQFQLKHCDLKLANGKITEIGDHLTGDEIINMSGKYVLPGFIDTHIHGACGTRVSDIDADLNKITQFEVTQGVTGIALTMASSNFCSILDQIDRIVVSAEQAEGTRILGIHAEGPFLNKKYKGAMNPDYIIEPNIIKLENMIQHGKGLLKILTVAPEMPGAIELIKYAVDKGIVVSMGHTDAIYEEAQKGIEAGISQLTHAFNAARAYNHREPGVLGAAMLSQKITCEMICDYVHLHPATIEMIYKLKGADKINIVSDSGHAAGMNISKFEVDGLVRYVKDGVVRLADGTIAGSAKTLLDGVKNLLKSGIPMGDVVKMASYNPAKSLQVEHLMGSIAVGKQADLVVLDSKYDVVFTFIDGVCLYKRV